jgi:selenocysteine lyase/cysteine desulfurase
MMVLRGPTCGGTSLNTDSRLSTIIPDVVPERHDNPPQRPFGRAASGYLDTATYGLPAASTLSELTSFTEAWQSGEGNWIEWEAAAEECRSLFADIVGAAADRIALVPSVSQATAIAVSGVPDRGEILIPEGEFASIVLPGLAAAGRGITVRRAPLVGLADAVDARTDMVAVSQVQSSSGEVADLAAIVTAARGHGARVYVDATQGLGAVPLDATAPAPHFVACAAYKWLCCPRGVAFLSIVPELIAELPPPAPASWRGARRPYESFYPVSLDPSPTASRFDLPLAWQAWVGARAALREIVEIGEERRRALAMAVALRLAANLERAAPDAAILRIAVRDADAALHRLRDTGIKASIRGSAVRLSPHFYNDLDDADRAAEVLAPMTV